MDSDYTFWIDSPSILFERRIEIIPIPGRTVQRNLNSLVRYFIVLGVVMAVVKQNFSYLLLIPISALASIVLLYTFVNILHSPEEPFNELDKCQRPTPENPTMNVLYGDPVDRLPACDANDPIIKKEIDESLAKAFNIPVDVDNIYNREGKSLNMYTNPSTTVANDERQNYLDFIAKDYSKKSCKEDSKFCKIREDLRQFGRTQ